MSGSTRKEVTIYTDGACSGNPGPGGYAVVLLSGSLRKELSGGFRRTTNNRMELRAAIAGLQSLRQACAVRLYTDSKYLADSVMLGWAKRWQARNWKHRGGTRVNADLWKLLLELCARHEVRFLWVRGHANDVENERCDVLAVLAAQQPDLPVDPGYEIEQDEAMGFRL
jgi:ribonuclease HI